jgi:hypothetical protein
MVTIPKRARAEKSEEHRTLGLVSHASKVLTRILGRRNGGKMEENLSENQFEYRKNGGTRETILWLRLRIEKIINMDKPLYIAFLD